MRGEDGREVQEARRGRGGGAVRLEAMFESSQTPVSGGGPSAISGVLGDIDSEPWNVVAASGGAVRRTSAFDHVNKVGVLFRRESPRSRE